MTRPPRPSGASILEKRFIGRIAVASFGIAGVTLATYWLAVAQGQEQAAAQTWAVTALVIGQAAYLVNSRFMRKSSLRKEALTGNPTLWRVIGILVVLHLGFVYLPFMHSWFGTAPIGLVGWGLGLAASVVVFLLVEAGKLALRTIESRQR